jgi:outer membrane protein assembly factor BamB
MQANTAFRLLALALLASSLAGCKIFGGTDKKDNVDPPTELTKFDPVVRVDRVWSTSVGKGERKLGLRQVPAIGDGRVYTANLAGDVVAHGADNGRNVWRSETDLPLSAGPTLGEGTLVVGSLDGDVLALNPDTGVERWRATVSSEVVARPAIGRGIAVVRANDGRVFGFNITDGSRRWVYDRGLPSLTLRGNAAPVIAGDSVYLGYDSGEVIALRLDDGTQRWEQRIAEPEGRTELERMVDIDGELVATPGELYAASYKGQVVALDPGSGRQLWNRDLVVYTGLTLAGDHLLVTDRAGTVWALDRRSGAAVWRHDGLAHRWLTTPAAHGDYVVVGDLEGYLHWLRLDNGEIAARERPSRKPIRGTPQVVDGTLYALSTDGKLAVYRLVP